LSVDEVIKTCNLGDGVTVIIKDCTRHYFGGYYHVRIQVSADVPVSVATCELAADFEDALVRLGHSVTFSRTLEKMAVPEDEIEDVRQQLVAAFDANVLPYLLRDNFTRHFVCSEYHKKLKSVPNFSGKYV
jgi:hypothetical protein